MNTIRELQPSRSYRGEREGEFAAAFFNSDRDGRDRALQLFRELLALAKITEPTGGGACKPDSPVNRLLRRYWRYPALTFIEGKGKFEFSFVNDKRPLNFEPLEEWQAIDGITTLGEMGLLHRLRECKTCGKWLYAKFERQTHCTDSCRSKEYQATAKWRERRRIYMRRYRAQPDQQRSKLKSVRRRRGK